MIFGFPEAQDIIYCPIYYIEQCPSLKHIIIYAFDCNGFNIVGRVHSKRLAIALKPILA